MSLAQAGVQKRRLLVLAVGALLALLLAGIGLTRGGYWRATAREVPLDRDLVPRLAEIERATPHKPVIFAYTTGETYRAFLADGGFSQRIWFQKVLVKPALPDRKLPTFWQFTSRTRVAGVNTYVDLNFFNGVRVGVETP